MKKILLVLAALVAGAVTFSAQAQLKITGSDEGAKKIATLVPSKEWIYQMAGEYYIVMISTNQFDHWYRLDLGPDRESAAATARDLLQALERAKKGAHLRIESRGEKYLLTKDVMMGVQMWTVSAVDTREVYAGVAYMEASVLRKAIQILE